MENNPLLPPDQEVPISVDTTLLGEVVRNNAARLLLAGTAVFGVFAIWQLFFTPQTYRGEVSIAMQQSGSSSLSGIGALLGAPSASKKYIGLLKSRNLAETVEARLHLQQFYKLKTHEDALDLLMDNMKPEDSATDGLLMVRLTLPGPAALLPDPDHKRTQAKKLVAEATNLYAKALADYYDASNTERDNVLLKAAENETQLARQEYDQSTRDIRTFVRKLDDVPVRQTPTGTIESGGASQDLIMLYEEEDKVEADIRSATAIQETQRRLTAVQLNNLNSLPAEDILLNDARAAQHRAEITLKKRQDVYGPDNPLVKEAQESLRHANEELERQKQGISELRTTDQVELSKKLEGLRAKRDTIRTRLAALESNVSTKRGLTARLELLRNEQLLTLKRLEEAIVKSVEVRLSAVSGKSMISVVDTAQPPRQGSPSMFRTVLVGGLLAILIMATMVIAEYLKQARRKTLAALQFAVATQNLAFPMPEGFPTPTHSTAGSNGVNGIGNRSGHTPSDGRSDGNADVGNQSTYPPV